MRKKYSIIFLSLLFVIFSFVMGYAQPTQLVIVRASDNSLWKATCTGTSCTSFTSFTGLFQSQPAVTWDESLQRFVVWGRASDSTIWRCTFNSEGTFMNDWTRITGLTPSPVAVAGSDVRRAGFESSGNQTISIGTLSTNCSARTTIASLTMSLPTRPMNVTTLVSGIFKPDAANYWVSICINDTSDPASHCDSFQPYMESSVATDFAREKHFAIQEIQYGLTGTQTFWVTACREAGATGTLFINDFIATAVPASY